MNDERRRFEQFATAIRPRLIRNFLVKSYLSFLLSFLTMVSPVRADDLASLRESISKLLEGAGACSAISQTPEMARSFCVNMRDGHGFDIIVKEKPLLSQKEWTAESRELQVLIDKGLNAKSAEDFSPEEFQAAMELLTQIPSYRYRHIGVDISIEDPELAHPENKKRREVSESVFKRIQALLIPYREE